MATLSPQVSAAGIVGPDYSDILVQLQYGFWAIYGSDAVLTADSQDGQLLALFAQAIYDAGQAVVAAYNNFSPATAQGAGLSSVVKINGLARDVSSSSTVSVTIIGQAGAMIANGQVGDTLGLGTVWNLPASVTIPSGGSVTVTATSTTPGAVAAAPGPAAILTPTFGWQSAAFAAAATVGAAVESDAALRQRQAASTGLPAQTPMQAISAAVANIPGVTAVLPLQNSADAVDPVTGLPPHSIALVVAGGAPSIIAQTIALKKAPGIQTVGNTSVTVLDSNGVPNQINFYVQSQTQIFGSITLAPNASYAAATGATIINAVVAFINGLGGDQGVYLNKLWAPANLSGDAATNAAGMTQQQLDALSASYNVTSIQIGLSSTTLGGADIILPFYTDAVTSIGNWQLAA